MARPKKNITVAVVDPDGNTETVEVKTEPQETGIVKMTIPVLDIENGHDFPPGGSDGKGNLFKYVNASFVPDLERAGWKMAR